MVAYDTEANDEIYLDQKAVYFSHQVLSPFDDRLEAQDDIGVESQYVRVIFKWS